MVPEPLIACAPTIAPGSLPLRMVHPSTAASESTSPGDAVDPDPSAAVQASPTVRALSPGFDTLWAAAPVGSHRRLVEHRAAAAAHRSRQAIVQINADDVDVEHVAPLRQRLARTGAARWRCTRVVDQDVDPAECLDGGFHHARDALLVGDVHGEREPTPTVGLELLHHALRCRGIDVGDDDGRTLVGEPVTVPPADPGARPNPPRASPCRRS
jgi:hypothetical protein